MKKSIAYRKQHQDLMLIITAMMLELAKRAKDIEPGNRRSADESMQVLASLNRELAELNDHIQAYAVKSGATYLTLLRHGDRRVEGRQEMHAELGRMTTKIMLDIRSRQALLARFAEVVQKNKLAFVAQYAGMFQEIQDGCREYHQLLKQVEARIAAFAAHMGKSLAAGTESKERKPQMLKRFMDFINTQTRKLGAKAAVLERIPALNPA